MLRIVATLMVVLVHVLGQSGLLNAAPFLSVNYGTLWLLRIAPFCAVNIYALISGYVGYGNRVRYSNIIYLTAHVMFYTISTTVVFLIFVPDLVEIRMIIEAIFPWAYRVYWYFQAYFFMFFFLPYLNHCMEKIDRIHADALMALIFLISLITTVLRSDFGNIGTGFSALWLALLYLMGAYIKKYHMEDIISRRKCVAGYGICVIVTWLVFLMLGWGTNHFSGTPRWQGILVEYTSPTILLGAVFLLMLFSRLQISPAGKRWVAFFAPVSFGVYLIHTEPLILKTFMNGHFVGYASLPLPLMLLAVIGTAIAIWFGCALLDHLRLMIFRIFKIRAYCERLEIFLRRKIQESYQYWQKNFYPDGL